MRKAVWLSLGVSFAVVGIALSASASDVSDLPPQVQARQYVREIIAAQKDGDDVKQIESFEKLFAVGDEVEIDPSFRFYYAKSLLAVGRVDDAKREVTIFLKASDIDPDLLDEALTLHEEFSSSEKGKKLYKEKEFKAAIPYLLPFAKGDVEISKMVGHAYLVANNPKESERWYLEAAELGGLDNQFELAVFYYGQALRGRVSAADENAFKQSAMAKKAFEWHRKLADQNYAGAYFGLAHLYQEGIGVTKDIPEALKYCKNAVDAFGVNASRAMIRIGMIYMDGDGVSRDMQEALKWLTRAADAGEAQAMFLLGKAYENGDGVAQNYRTAYAWYTKAREKGWDVAGTAIRNIAPHLK